MCVCVSDLVMKRTRWIFELESQADAIVEAGGSAAGFLLLPVPVPRIRFWNVSGGIYSWWNGNI